MFYLGRLSQESTFLNRHPDYEPELLKKGDPEFKFFTATEPGNSLIGQARDRVVASALALETDYLFFFDDDMRFANDVFLRLWRNHVPVCAALAFTARLPIAPVLFRLKRDFDPVRRIEHIDTQVIWDYPRDALVRVDAVGTGVILIDCSVFRKMSKDGPWFNGAVGSGEDIHFAWKAGRVGVPIYCDTRVKTAHRPNEPQRWHDEEYYLESRKTAADHNEPQCWHDEDYLESRKTAADHSHTDLQQFRSVVGMP